MGEKRFLHRDAPSRRSATRTYALGLAPGRERACAQQSRATRQRCGRPKRKRSGAVPPGSGQALGLPLLYLWVSALSAALSHRLSPRAA